MKINGYKSGVSSFKMEIITLRAVRFWNNLTITTAWEKKTRLHKKGLSSDYASRAADLVTWEVAPVLHSCEGYPNSFFEVSVCFATCFYMIPMPSALYWILSCLLKTSGNTESNADCWSVQWSNTSGDHGTGDTQPALREDSFLRWVVDLPRVSEACPPFPRVTQGPPLPPGTQEQWSGTRESLQPAGTALPLAGGTRRPFRGAGTMTWGVPISYSSYEKPPGNLPLKQTTELRCGLASPLLNHCVARFWCRGCPCSITRQGREGQTKYNTRPFHQVDKLNVFSVWSDEKQKKKKAHLQP